jgi:hypothetical protein
MPSIEKVRTPMQNERDLREQYSWVDWDKAIIVALIGKSGWACRYCIAQDGLKSTDTDKVFDSEADFQKHLREKHGRP